MKGTAMSTLPPARTYNQKHNRRKYTPGKRRQSTYRTCSYPWESERDAAAMENRLSTMTEVPHRAVAKLRDSGVECGTFPPGDCGHAGTVPPLHAQLPANCR